VVFADYTPIFLSSVPELFLKKRIPIDVALVQTSLPDAHGYMSLVSVSYRQGGCRERITGDRTGQFVYARVQGDSFIHIDDVDFVVLHDEPLLEFEAIVPDEIAEHIGKYVSQIVQDGDTIQVATEVFPMQSFLTSTGKNISVCIQSCSPTGLWNLSKKVLSIIEEGT